MAELPRRPCLALPFTLVGADDGVHLLAGEDWRYVVTGPGLRDWLPAWLDRVDGTRTREQLLGELAADRRTDAEAVLRRLQGERLLREGPAEAGHVPTSGFEVLGDGPLATALASRGRQPPEDTPLSPEARPPGADAPGSSSVTLVVQDSLDYATALAHNARLRAAGRRWLWVSTGAMTRGYVGPLFLPDAGPCLACLVGHFRRLSPAPHLYDLLQTHDDIRPSPLPPEANQLVVAVALAKVAMAREAQPRPALYRLHVVEADTLEVTTHAVPRDPDCRVCGAGR